MPKLGGTGDFPRGKIHHDDEGGLRLGGTVKDGLDKASALELAETIRRHAEQIR